MFALSASHPRRRPRPFSIPSPPFLRWNCQKSSCTTLPVR
ncbi:hypothetical protein JMJ77_0003571 [Colletotrichum scovillei]|uniref:Uncharacterized protein n=1 Tax=Colletotrichum scovillei TaxID=1209932 RepID=A0A9P7QW97_9PEZI|nr:hypothetical protein JMJ78_0005079 [Colletotrichum scovillei]KAG7041466.1 hypothetical protein JMJ77_0003571 [Colletotrichum scovillei]KAG7061498.1 hypothetical protein JMJ76_0001061 [Colletotrichum scovillei]